MREVQILAVGKLRDRGLESLCEDYFRRLESWRVRVRQRELRDLKQLAAALPPRGTVVMLDERGRQLDSRSFAAELERWLSDPAGPLCLVIGGAEGLSDELRARAHLLLSLSKMTLAHRLVRLVLAEQLYRAVSILEGAPYHRE